ncbi:MAG: lysine--tRNA ligase [Spirochaetes bacterium]|nr:lysine--tRNA ligase [Spirochaetota bacterium]
MSTSSDERDIRIEKVERIRQSGINPYPDRAEKTHSLAQASQLAEGTDQVQIVGRMMLKRVFGKLIFATLQDFSGRLQIALDKKNFENEQFGFFQKNMDVGDFVAAAGEIFKTQKGEITLNVRKFQLLSKSIRPLPEKFHGLTDLEAKSRQRYLDVLMNDDSKNRFLSRIKVINTIRDYLNKNEFIEVETPILQAKPSGALAKPFKTHHNALDIDMFLRIAPETYLKRCIAGGFERVYEFARCFRNEGMGPAHLQEFTMLEYYCAFWNYQDNMKFTEKLIKHVLQEVHGSLEIEYQGTKINFDGDWPQYSFQELIIEHAGIDINQCPTKEALLAEMKKRNIEIEGIDYNKIGRGNLIDQLYKKVARPKMINPQFLIHHPTDLSPLARKNDDNPHITDRFQLVINTWEMLNAYSELVDPVDQRERLLKQAQEREKGDEEAMIMEEDFIQCMEYGMPPMSGWGMGIDRFTALLTNQENLREVVLFPIMRSLDTGDKNMEEDDERETGGKSKENIPDTEDKTYSPEDIPDLGIGFDKLDDLFQSKITREHLKHHAIASAAIMQGIAAKFGLNEKHFYYIGLLHDIDLEEVGPDMTRHAKVGSEWLAEMGMNKKAVHAIAAHNEGTGVTRNSFVDYALTCAETISGLAAATAKVYPDKKITSVKPKSIRKRMKEKAFAANVNRDNILLCEKIGLSLDDFIVLTIESMIQVADQIGL